MVSGGPLAGKLGKTQHSMAMTLPNLGAKAVSLVATEAARLGQSAVSSRTRSKRFLNTQQRGGRRVSMTMFWRGITFSTTPGGPRIARALAVFGLCRGELDTCPSHQRTKNTS